MTYTIETIGNVLVVSLYGLTDEQKKRKGRNVILCLSYNIFGANKVSNVGETMTYTRANPKPEHIEAAKNVVADFGLKLKSKARQLRLVA